MNRACIASAALLCAMTASRADSLALDDPNGLFSGAAHYGSASMSFQDFRIEPLGSTCLHDADDFLDFAPLFSPEMPGVGISPLMLEGFVLNTNGTLRLELGLDGWGCSCLSSGFLRAQRGSEPDVGRAGGGLGAGVGPSFCCPAFWLGAQCPKSQSARF